MEYWLEFKGLEDWAEYFDNEEYILEQLIMQFKPKESFNIYTYWKREHIAQQVY